MMTALPEKAIAATATRSVPTTRDLCCAPSNLDPVGGCGEALGFVLVVLRVHERSLRRQQQRLQAVRIARRTGEADRGSHGHPGEFELQRGMNAAREGLAFRVIPEAMREHRELVVADAGADVRARLRRKP